MHYNLFIQSPVEDYLGFVQLVVFPLKAAMIIHVHVFTWTSAFLSPRMKYIVHMGSIITF